MHCALLSSINGDLWGEYFEHADQRVGVEAIFRKIKSHCGALDVWSGRIGYTEWCGNHWADVFAGLAAEKASLPQAIVEHIHAVDALAWKVQRRIVQTSIAAISHAELLEPDEARFRPLPRIILDKGSLKKRKLDKARELAIHSPHELRIVGNKWQCQRCMLSSSRPNLEAWLKDEGAVCTPIAARRSAASRGAVRTIGSASVHESHSLYHRRGLLVCTRCAAYGSIAPRKLKLPCLPRRLTIHGKDTLKRLWSGRELKTGLGWPLAEGEGPPDGPV